MQLMLIFKEEKTLEKKSKEKIKILRNQRIQKISYLCILFLFSAMGPVLLNFLLP